MARIRTIKPEFFTSEDIVELSLLARLLYIALWCEADREGRLEWKPKTFKIRYFPTDDCDMTAVAQELLDRKLVVLYGEGLAYIPSFQIHQHINPRESASTLPEPKNTTRRARVSHASPTSGARDSDVQVGRGRKGRERKGKEGEGTLVVPTVAEVHAYALEEFNLNGEFAEDFVRTNNARNWKDKTGKPYENWKLVVGSWVRKLSPEDRKRLAPKQRVDTSMVHR